MPKKMLIDATHPEETRVVVVDGNKVDDFDFESINKRQLAGNIYLAKVTRVEPSLQAAFVDYGGNRHGFLAFAEIHPDYYQIPVADREALLAEEAAEEEEARKATENGNGNGNGKAEKPQKPRKRRARRNRREKEESANTEAETAGGGARSEEVAGLEVIEPEGDDEEEDTLTADISGLEVAGDRDDEADGSDGSDGSEESAGEGSESSSPRTMSEATGLKEESVSEEPRAQSEDAADDGAEMKKGGGDSRETSAEAAGEAEPAESGEPAKRPRRRKARRGKAEEKNAEAETAAGEDEEMRPEKQVDEVGAEDLQEEVAEIRRARRRRYKIQDVIKVRQIMLVQVVKEERGNKGAALTTYLSLAGRYCVLMPNTARGGGISRKITQAADRKRLREVVSEFDVPKGMGLIVRTAGAERTRAEIKRDYEFLLRQWEQIRELTLKSIAPTLIYEEASLIKRAIRDLYSKEIDAILVEGDTGYREAKDYMKMLMPSHAKNVRQYSDPIPLFIRYQVESYLNAMFNPTVQLKSGGYIVIGVTEALVAIDVNSGRSTREGSIEETALKTNLEAADEVARQLRLRDLAGLIVIDFIDMDEARNNRSVEKRMKDRLKTDRARIQVGRISPFGLMEMSRQRLRPGMLEATTQPCPNCHGQGVVRSDESLALSILRELEEEGVRGRSAEVALAAPVGIVNFLVNHKRKHLSQIEDRYGMVILLEGSPDLTTPNYTIERSRTASRATISTEEEEVVTAESVAAEEEAPVETAAPEPQPSEQRDEEPPGGEAGARRRRGKRGGRRRRGRGNGEQPQEQAAAAAEEEGQGGEEGEGRSRRRRRRRGREEQAEGRPEAQAEESPETQAEESPEAQAERAPAAAVPEPAEEPAERAEPPKSPAETAASEEVREEVRAEPAQPEPTEETPSEQEETHMEPPSRPELAPEVAEQIAGEPASEAAPEVKSSGMAEAAPEEPAAAPEPADGGDSQQEDAREAEPEQEADSDRPAKRKRRGWWSLGGFR